MRSFNAAVLLLLACATVQSATAQAAKADPMAGTWKLNVEKSTYTAGPGPRALTYRYENRADGLTLWVASSIGATGAPGFSFSLCKYDGQDYPAYNVATMTTFLAEGAKTNWTQASRLIDAYTTELMNKTDGAVTGKVVRTMARDGKTVGRQTIRATDLPPNGSHRFSITFDAAGKSWVRFSAYDSAGNAAFAQPRWLDPENR